jgi:hypothetical protein
VGAEHGEAMTARGDQVSTFIAGMAVAPQGVISARRARQLYARLLREHIATEMSFDPLR